MAVWVLTHRGIAVGAYPTSEMLIESVRLSFAQEVILGMSGTDTILFNVDVVGQRVILSTERHSIFPF